MGRGGVPARRRRAAGGRYAPCRRSAAPRQSRTRWGTPRRPRSPWAAAAARQIWQPTCRHQRTATSAPADVTPTCRHPSPLSRPRHPATRHPSPRSRQSIAERSSCAAQLARKLACSTSSRAACTPSLRIICACRLQRGPGRPLHLRQRPRVPGIAFTALPPWGAALLLGESKGRAATERNVSRSGGSR